MFLVLFSGQKAVGQCHSARTIIEMMDTLHFSPLLESDSLSSYIFFRFIDEVDQEKMVFTQQDVEKLSKFKHDVFKRKDNPCEMLNKVASTYNRRIAMIDSLMESFVLEIDYWKGDLVYDERDFDDLRPKDFPSLMEKWKVYFAYNILFSMYERHANSGILNTDTAKKYLSEKSENFIRKLHCRLHQLANPTIGKYKELEELYFNTIATTHDPHSQYFSNSEMELFETHLSKETLGFGFELDKDNFDNLIVSGILPGSAAWKSRKINVNDKVVQISTQGNNIEIECSTLSEIFQKLNEHSVHNVELILRKQDGKEETVTLMKEKMNVEENVIKSYVLDDGAGKIGYISLPSFYTSWDEESEEGCANDVAKEIFKLKQSGIEGLILDLRYNAGGSMYEAINLAGIFIDYGPLCFIADKNRDIHVLKDLNRGKAYSGPLVVMVNGASASASEIVAGTLQDYNRAIIVGKTTFGKGSSQYVLPVFLDAWSDEPQGFLKLTLNKFYRLNGVAYQANGIKPDIEVPDVWEKFMDKESDQVNAFKNDTIVKEITYTPLPALPLPQLRAGSEKRIGESAYFSTLETVRQKIDDFDFPCKATLNTAQFGNYFQEYEKAILLLKEIPKFTHPEFNVSFHKFEKSLLFYSEEERTTVELLKEEISTDGYIFESYKVLIDFINLKEQKQ